MWAQITSRLLRIRNNSISRLTTIENIHNNNLLCNRTRESANPRQISMCAVNNSIAGESCMINFCPSVHRSFSTTNVVAKSKDKGKDKKSKEKVLVNENELGEVINLGKLKQNLEKAIEDLRQSFIKNLTLRSTAGSIEQLKVTFEEQEYELQELVQIARKPKTIVLNMSVFPQAIPAVLEALSKSGMNLNPQQDGTTIFIPIPKVTKEHRENLSKNAKTLYIRCRDNIKDLKNKEATNLKKIESMSIDDKHRIKGQLDTYCEQYIKEAEKILDTKQQELLGSSS